MVLVEVTFREWMAFLAPHLYMQNASISTSLTWCCAASDFLGAELVSYLKAQYLLTTLLTELNSG